MKYIALLRGINVGGKGIIPMKKLKEVAEKAGFENVKTYIQSGNVIFESDENKQLIRNKFESTLEKEFFLKIPVVIRSVKEPQKI